MALGSRSSRDDVTPGEVNDVKESLLNDDSQVLREEEEAAKAAKSKSNALIISFVAMVIVGLGNKIFQPLQFIPMYHYPLFTNLLTTFVYIPCSFAYIFPMAKWGSLITKEALEVPKYKFAIMGLLDSTAGVMQSLAVNFLQNGGLVILLSQAAIPMSMIITKIFLKTKYKMSQYVGALVVSAFLMVVMIPFFKNPHSQDGNNTILWAAIMVISCIPMTLSSVYKEKALGETEIDAVYLNGWVAFFQFLVAIPLLFPSAPAARVPIEELPKNLWDGARCFVGINSITSGPHPDNCSESPVYVTCYLLFNLNYNVLIILILKYGSSNILWLAMTVMVPMGNLAFSLPFMPDRKSIHITDLIGLLGIMLGLMIYRFWTPLKKLISRMRHTKSDEEEDDPEAFLSTPSRGPGPHTMRRASIPPRVVARDRQGKPLLSPLDA